MRIRNIHACFSRALVYSTHTKVNHQHSHFEIKMRTRIKTITYLKKIIVICYSY